MPIIVTALDTETGDVDTRELVDYLVVANVGNGWRLASITPATLDGVEEVTLVVRRDNADPGAIAWLAGEDGAA